MNATPRHPLPDTPISSREGPGVPPRPAHLEQEDAAVEARLDEALEETFPASDPVAVTSADAPAR